MTSNDQLDGRNQLNQRLWHKIIRQAYTIECCMFELTSQQVGKLLQSQSHQQLNSILTFQQKQLITLALAAAPHHALFPKVNGRTPKDLPPISRQIRKITDFIDILHSSEYILEGLHQNGLNHVVLRHYMKQLAERQSIYEVFVRGGFVVAIGQKYCDHVQTKIEDETVLKIIEVAQEIMPAITLLSPKGNSHQLNSFVASIFHRNSTTKITSIRPYPPYPEQTHCILGEEEVQKYYKQIVEEKKHRSEQERYANNEGVVPILRTVVNESEIKHYDMGEYLIGNEIDSEEKMKEWKQFMQEAKDKIEDD